ncbi:MAG TPA: nicotinate-nucleotide adenylyltransferase [Bacteroidota bacterium]
MTRSRKRNRIGIFGGSFDPPHLGHLIAAEVARQASSLDAVIFVPAFQPPHKLRTSSARPAQRMEMTRLAVRGNRCFSVSDYEIRRGGISFTVDTLRALVERHPSSEFSLIIGADSFVEFSSWKSPDEIIRMAGLLVYPRTGYERPSTGMSLPPAEFLRAPVIDLSSSMIRRRVREGLSVRYLVPVPVERYIQTRKLYRADPA